MRFTIAILLTLFTYHFTAGQEITVSIEAPGCPKIPAVYQFNGLDFVAISQAEKTSETTFSIRLKKGSPKFMYWGVSKGKLSPILLGSEDSVVIKGNCQQPTTAVVTNSPLNTGYQKLKSTFQKHQRQTQTQAKQYMSVANDSVQQSAAKAEMAKTDNQKLKLLNDTKESAPFLGKIVAINTYLSYPNQGKDKYPDEINYFANEYFRFADLSDPEYNHITYLYEAFRRYASTLNAVSIPDEMHQKVLNSQLNKIPAGSMAKKYALAGVVNALQQKKHPNYTYFGNQLVEAYGDEKFAALEQFRKRMLYSQSLVVGGEAPDFEMATPDGEPKNLHSLRGKVLLIDFWASWCGPCRRENPNVVKVYNAYKDQGFDILSVSLDKTKDRWLQAIEKDGMVWHHVSDLKGWKNAAAQMYGVSSIPHTILLDKDGKIIARNLRGPALEKAVKKALEDQQ